MKDINNYINESLHSQYHWNEIVAMFNNITKKLSGGLCNLVVDGDQVLTYLLAKGDMKDKLKKVAKTTFQSSDKDIIYCVCDEDTMTSDLYALIGKYTSETAKKVDKNTAVFAKYHMSLKEFQNNVPERE